MQDVKHWCRVGLRLPCGRGHDFNAGSETCYCGDLYNCVGIEACNVDELHGEDRHGDCRGRVTNGEVSLGLGARRCSEDL